MQDRTAVWLHRQLLKHGGVFFSKQLFAALNHQPIHFLPMNQALETSGPSIVIATDSAAPRLFDDPWPVTAYGARMTLCHRLSMPDCPGWEAWPTREAPLWYLNASGTRMPAWDLYGTLVDLMTLANERTDTRRDSHGRFVAAFDPRGKHDLLAEPLFNYAAYVLACESLCGGKDRDRMEGASELKPPILVLSHDCDVLEGNDRYTQAIRLFRTIQPLAHFRPPRLSNLWWLVRNAALPRDFYFDNCRGLITMERTFGYTSTFYLLNGTGGRFGARNGSAPIKELVAEINEPWSLGMHYNYDTLLADAPFDAQKAELEQLAGSLMEVGRAHYLRFDPERSFDFLHRKGISLDESLGYPDRIGFRAGVAGAYHPFDEATGEELSLLEVPMAVMENTLLRQYRERSLDVFRGLLEKVASVGGALSVIFHPGAFFNPEFPELRQLYHRMLVAGKSVGAEGIAASELAERFRGVDINNLKVE